MPEAIINKDFEKRATEYAKQNGLAERWNIFEDNSEFAIKSAVTADNCACVVGETIKIEGYLSTFKNVDRQGDVVAAGAFDKTVKKQKVYPLLKNHNYCTEQQMGDFTCKVDDYGLQTKAEIVCTPENMHECMLIKAGKLKTTSMGGLFKYSDKKDKNGNNIIEEVELLEGSIVSIPANPLAIVTRKSLYEEAKSEPVANAKSEPVAKTKAEELKILLRSK